MRKGINLAKMMSSKEMDSEFLFHFLFFRFRLNMDLLVSNKSTRKHTKEKLIKETIGNLIFINTIIKTMNLFNIDLDF